MLVQWVLTGTEDAGAVTELMDLPALRIEACTACGSCSMTGVCVHNDDFSALFSRMIAADGIVPGSPVSIDNVTGHMKVFIYRLADAMHYQTLSGKYGCAVTTTFSSGGDDGVSYLNHVLTCPGIPALEGITVAVEDNCEATEYGERKARMPVERLAGAIRTQEKFPGQERIMAENRLFFASIADQNREWRPGEYQDWARKGWIS